MLLGYFLQRMIRVGTLKIIDADGSLHQFSATPEPCVVVRLHDRALPRRLLLSPELRLGEAYMDGSLTIGEGGVYDLLALHSRNLETAGQGVLWSFLSGFVGVLQVPQQYIPLPRARGNESHHYDRRDEIFDAFLDADRHYSCAFYHSGSDRLETAQENKVRHIAAKLLIEPGMQVLDIGSGWGGLAFWLARECRAQVTGVTLAERQLAFAERWAGQAGLSDTARFFLRDYREESGTYDRIVSIGMFEHVGAPHYNQFFAKIRDCLTENGVALIHSIGRSGGPGIINAWIRKYIFPGGYIPALLEVAAAVENSGLLIADAEILRLHYAETLQEWRRRFMANCGRLAHMCDDRFCRMWEFYLAMSEVAFRYGGMMVFQMQLARRIDAVPLTRDYIVDRERGMFRPAAAAAQ